MKKQKTATTAKIEAIDFNQQFQKDYTDYGTHVIRERALPDVRDGLKPVQRRVLYTCYEDKLMSKNDYKKSAKIVGDVMGNYHPHGDCLAGDTRVLLCSGELRTMKELYEDEQDEFLVWGTNQQNEIVPVVAHNFRIGQWSKEMYHIHTGNDCEICVTKNHPFRLANGQYIKAEDVAELDRLRYADATIIGDDVVLFNQQNNDYFTTIGYDEAAQTTTQPQVSQRVAAPIELVSAVDIEYLDREEPFYDFTVDDEHNMFVMSGVVKMKDTNGKEHRRVRLVDVHNSSIYEALVTMAQSWANPIPPIEPKGNFGGITGDPPAAMRYTESKLSKFGDLFVSGLKNKTVPFVPNFDNTRTEPTVLPVTLPYLLIAGDSGIAVGVKTEIPTHNPREALNVVLAYLKNSKIKLDELMKIMPGPDFTTGGEIVNQDEVKRFYETGIGRLIVRGHLKQIAKNKIQLDTIPVTWINQLDAKTSKISDKIANNQLPGVVSVQSYTNKNGIDVEFNLRPGFDAKRTMQMLYAKTDIEDTYSIQFYAIVDGAPQQLGLKDYLANYVHFQHQLLIKAAKHRKDDIEHQLEILKGLLLAFDHIDAIVDLVQHTHTNSYLKKILTTVNYAGNTNQRDMVDWRLKKHATEIKRLVFSEVQAEAILNTPLKRLSRLDVKELTQKEKRLTRELKTNEQLINSKQKRKQQLIKQTEAALKLFGDCPRKTKLSAVGKVTYKPEEVITNTFINVDKYGYVHNTAKELDVPNSIFAGEFTSQQSFGFFTNKGNFYQIKLKNLSLMKPKDKGTTLAAQCKLPITEKPLLNRDGDLLALNIPAEQLMQRQILMVTADHSTGRISGKLVTADNYLGVNNRLVGTKLGEHQHLICAFVLPDKLPTYFVLVTAKGKAKKMLVKNLKVYGKAAQGLLLGKLDDNDELEFVQLGENSDSVMLNNHPLLLSDLKTMSATAKFK